MTGLTFVDNRKFRIDYCAMRIDSFVTVDRLRAAISLGDTLSFTESARDLHLSQSSLSRRISDLEKVLKVKLFDRTTRSVEPTLPGKEMLVLMRRTLQMFDQGVAQMRRQAAGESGTVTVSCLPSIAASYLPNFIRDFVDKYPDVRVEIRDALKAQVVDLVRGGEVDFGITATTHLEPDLTYERIGADKFYCALPPEHPLAERESIDWSMLSGERLIMFSSFTSISRPVELSLEKAGIVTEKMMVGHNVGTVAGLVASGLGVTAVPELVKPLMEFARLSFVPLTPTIERDIFIIRRKGEEPSAAVENFIRPLRQATDPWLDT